MSKAMGSWSAIRKYLEQDMLCESLRGRVRYGCTKYPNTDTDMEFADALEEYRRINIKDAINNANPIVRMFAVLDRRVGKRTLFKLSEKADLQPAWLQFFYRLRLDSEKIKAEW